MQTLKQSDQLRFGGIETVRRLFKTVRRLFNPPKRCDDFFVQRPEHGHGKTVKRMDSQTSPHPTRDGNMPERGLHTNSAPSLTSMGDFLLEFIRGGPHVTITYQTYNYILVYTYIIVYLWGAHLVINDSSHKHEPSRCRSTSISNARASSMSLHVKSLTCTQLDQKSN